jgi:RHH-type proline utilization regulon transcriptional repressor/proline dehydrogenase/delta 1-pyrroline-5-carboxylate dehydrogenase
MYGSIRSSGALLAMQAYQTVAGFDPACHQRGLKYKLRLMCRLVKGAYRQVVQDQARAQEMGLPRRFTHKHHTDVCYLYCCALCCSKRPTPMYGCGPQLAGTIAPSCCRRAMPYRLDAAPAALGEGIFREVLKNPLISAACAPVNRTAICWLIWCAI